MTTLGIIFGFICFYCVYLFFTLINWLDREWQSITAFALTLAAVVFTFTSALALTVFIRKWVNVQVLLNQSVAENSDSLGVESRAVKVANALMPFFSIAILVRSAFIFFAIFNTLYRMSVGGIPEDIIDHDLQLWNFVPGILINALMFLGAIALLKRKAVAVVFFGLALLLSCLNSAYFILRDLDQAASLSILIVLGQLPQALPVGYGVYLLKGRKLW